VRTLVVLIAVAVCSVPVLGQVVVRVPAARDNTLYDDGAGQLSNGGGTAMFAGNNAAGERRRALVYFDVAGHVPAGMTITGARLTLANSAANVSPVTISVHRVLEGWGEGASVAVGGGQGRGAQAEPGDATWLHRFYPGVFWSTPGGVFDPAASAWTVVGGVGLYAWESSGLAADVQSFLDSPGSNHGWIIIGDESAAQTARRFSTREEPDPASRPVLEVTYIPGPAAWPLLAVLSAWARRRR
jgi:MYXO-CTERM domain-containing protein